MSSQILCIVQNVYQTRREKICVRQKPQLGYISGRNGAIRMSQGKWTKLQIIVQGFTSWRWCKHLRSTWRKRYVSSQLVSHCTLLLLALHPQCARELWGTHVLSLQLSKSRFGTIVSCRRSIKTSRFESRRYPVTRSFHWCFCLLCRRVWRSPTNPIRIHLKLCNKKGRKEILRHKCINGWSTCNCVATKSMCNTLCIPWLSERTRAYMVKWSVLLGESFWEIQRIPRPW